MRKPTRWLITLFFAAVAGPVAAPAAADLLPEEIAIIVARGNRESMALAKYYCQQRKVPVGNICEIDVPSTEELDHEHWKWAVRPEIQQWLATTDPEGKLRCWVTTWGVPLKIQQADADDRATAYLTHLEGERQNRAEQLLKIADLLDKIAIDPQQDAANDLGAITRLDNDAEAKEVEQRLEASLQAAQARLAGLPPTEAQSDRAQIQVLATQAAGLNVLMQGMAQQLQRLAASSQSPSASDLEKFNILRGRAGAFEELKQLLGQSAPDIERDTLVLTLLQQNTGLLGQVKWLDEQIATVRKNETGASFDSELALVTWADDYQLLQWQPNYLRPVYDGSQLRKTFRTFMVSRLDGPTLKIAKSLIDNAIAVERDGGLKGKAYFDARGLTEKDGPRVEPGSYPDFDRSLLITADQMTLLTDAAGERRFEVELNDQPELFEEGEAPDAALYCGWYSLGNYVDAFDWQKGAIAYHLASAEAQTLHDPQSKAWCKSLLDDGVCATIGPVYEPYLVAFPRPNEFFALLTAGDLCLAEVYSRTKPFNSWMMVLIGDPLYRPF